MKTIVADNQQKFDSQPPRLYICKTIGCKYCQQHALKKTNKTVTATTTTITGKEIILSKLGKTTSKKGAQENYLIVTYVVKHNEDTDVAINQVEFLSIRKTLRVKE